MTLLDIAKQVEKFAIDNSPALLTAVGVAGTVTTAVMAGRQSYHLGQWIEHQNLERVQHGEDELTKTEIVKKYWPDFIPTVAIGAISVTAIVASNRIGTRRAAAVAAAYTLSEKAFAEYRDKVVEKVGEKKHQAIKDEVAQKRVDSNPVSTNEVIITGTGEYMCYDTYTGRYFKSSQENIRRAENDTFKQVLDESYASLNDFFDRLRIPNTAVGEEVGFNYENNIEISFSSTISEDGQPCLAITYPVSPVRNYFRLR